MNIVLIGYRCSGKSKMGKILAGALDRDFLDTDSLIEQNSGQSIEALVSANGWEHFRYMEKVLIEEISKRDNLVIATGGGVVTDEENVKSLKGNGWIVWLSGKAEVLKERMDREQRSEKIRPSLTGADPQEEIKQVLKIRKPLYKQAADFVVDSGNLSIEELTATIIKALPKGLHG